MNFLKLVKQPAAEQNKKLNNGYGNLNRLLEALEKRTVPDSIVQSINQEIEKVNLFSGSNQQLLKRLRKTQSAILNLIEKDLGLVPKNYYRNRWLAIGLAVFGIPFGTSIGLSLGSMAFIGIGLPIGMAIGIAIGTTKDKKAMEEGNQLDFEVS